MPKVHIRASARRDLVDHFIYLSESAGPKVAERFLDGAESSFADLALQPAMGSPLTLRQPELDGMRKWRVRGFENFLIFYLLRPDGVSVVRVLYAAQDWWGLLGLEN